MRILTVFLGLLLIGGCVSSNGGGEVAASSSASRANDDGEGAKPRQVCEHTSIGGEPKSFCY